MGHEGCCVYPHGRLSIYATIVSISNFMFALTTAFGCYFVKVDYTFSELSQDGIMMDEKPSGIGILAYEDALRDGDSRFVCYNYSNGMVDMFDGVMKVTRVFGIMAIACTGLGCLAILLSSCFAWGVTVRRIVIALYFQAAVYELLTFLFFKSDLCSDGACKFSISAGLAIVSSVMAVINGVLVMKFPDNVIHDMKPAPFSPGTKTVTETPLENGQKKLMTTTVHADGSQVVEESIV